LSHPSRRNDLGSDIRKTKTPVGMEHGNTKLNLFLSMLPNQLKGGGRREADCSELKQSSLNYPIEETLFVNRYSGLEKEAERSCDFSLEPAGEGRCCIKQRPSGGVGETIIAGPPRFQEGTGRWTKSEAFIK